ncbi:MFS transporter [Nonomuraea longicatena]|uniref:MFS transporter n=1 Tax=Nonomuraea longicatena TaxID=83682 RepID=A0ABP3ZL55_9ACTN
MTIDTSRGHWGAVAAIAAGTFTVVTSEMLAVGLLTPIGRDLGVSDGTAGLTMTAPAITAALAAPTLVVATRRVDRRPLMAALMLLLVAANLLAALAPNFTVMVIARVLAGVSIGGFWAFAAALGMRLVPAAGAGRAASLITGGVSVASVVGVPTGTLISSLASWRWAFGIMAVLALAVLVALAALLPAVAPTTVMRLRGVWANPAARPVLFTTALLVIGHFAAYTYIRPFLERADAPVTLTLLVFGLAGVVGNFGAGALGSPRRVFAGIALTIAVATALLPLIDAPILLVALWGLVYGGVAVSCSMWILGAGGGEAGTALLSSIFNAAISAGAFIGGMVVDGVSVTAVMWLAAALALLSAAYAGMSGRSTTNGS